MTPSFKVFKMLFSPREDPGVTLKFYLITGEHFQSWVLSSIHYYFVKMISLIPSDSCIHRVVRFTITSLASQLEAILFDLFLFSSFTLCRYGSSIRFQLFCENSSMFHFIRNLQSDLFVLSVILISIICVVIKKVCACYLRARSREPTKFFYTATIPFVFVSKLEIVQFCSHYLNQYYEYTTEWYIFILSR